MANTFTLISTTTVGAGGAASIDFTSIPQTYTDLQLVLSGRSTTTDGTYDPLLLQFNSSTSGYSGRVLEAMVGAYTTSEAVATNTSTNASGTWARVTATGIPTANYTSNTFSNSQIHVPNYAGSTQKSFSCDTVGENNSTTSMLEITANLWTGTSAITSVAIALVKASFVQYSTASLYGILKGSGGATVS